MFPGQVIPAIQADLAEKAKADKLSAFKEAGLLEQNNQLPYGAKAIDVIPSSLRSEFTEYNDDPTNFKDSMHISPTGSLEWTDLTGSGRYVDSVKNDMAFNPQTGEYDIQASKLDANGKTTYKLNTTGMSSGSTRKAIGMANRFRTSWAAAKHGSAPLPVARQPVHQATAVVTRDGSGVILPDPSSFDSCSNRKLDLGDWSPRFLNSASASTSVL